jgi:hypothetical protein
VWALHSVFWLSVLWHMIYGCVFCSLLHTEFSAPSCPNVATGLRLHTTCSAFLIFTHKPSCFDCIHSLPTLFCTYSPHLASVQIILLCQKDLFWVVCSFPWDEVTVDGMVADIKGTAKISVHFAFLLAEIWTRSLQCTYRVC